MRGVKKIVLAVDSFKGSLTSLEVAEAVEKGIRDVLPEVEVCKLSVADGGEGTLAAVAACGCWERLGVRITDSLGRPREGVFCIRDSEALIETAQACGLTLLEENERNPEITTSYGVGELLGYALGQGCRRIYIGLGGSATNDGGMGMLRALGVRFLTPAGVELPGRGMDLRKVSQIDLSGLDVRLREVEIIVMCDVDNPLTGEQGGSKVYGKQKGGTDEMLEELDKGMENYADVIAATIGRDERNVPGAGAAGGLGFAIHTLLRGRIMPGIEEILEI
ncbi:MAG: glycerate kinase, partial [Muribaculaceae bacterium]|nr:glycerate kinase [Muribaculaceae bacterium]